MCAFLAIFSIILTLQAIQFESSYGFAVPQHLKLSNRALFDDELREIVEFLRLQMKCGYPPAGVPPLAPYHVDNIEFSYDSYPWKIEAQFTDYTITGLDEFDVVALSWNNFHQKLTFDFNFERILVKSNYKLDSQRSMRKTNVTFYGDGLLELELENFRANGSFRLKPTRSGGLQAYAFSVQLDMGAAHSSTTGFMNSAPYTKFLNDWIEEFLRLIFVESKQEVSTYIESIIVPPLNKAFQHVSTVQIIKLITGLADDVIPMEPYC